MFWKPLENKVNKYAQARPGLQRQRRRRPLRPQIYKDAVKWCRLAAEQGIVDAQYNLSICYHEGQGVEKDLEEANYWYTKAVEQDNVAASNIVKYFEDQKNVLNFDYWKKKSRK